MGFGPPPGALTGAESAALDALDIPEPPARRRRNRTYRDDFPRPLRLAILARAGFRCELCGQPLTLEPNQPNSGVAGHRLAAWAGGAPIESNGRAECQQCSRDSASREARAAARAGEAAWQGRRRPGRVR